MKIRWLVALEIGVIVATLLISCSPGNSFVPVTGNETRAVPGEIVLVRENVLTHIRSKYDTADLPDHSNWQWEVNIYKNPDQKGLILYTFTNGDRVVTISEPSSSVGKTRVTYINNATHFTWHGFMDENGNVSIDIFQR